MTLPSKEWWDALHRLEMDVIDMGGDKCASVAQKDNMVYSVAMLDQVLVTNC